jgi:hypothetical protein
MRRIVVQSPILKKTLNKKGLVEWLKFKLGWWSRP